MKKLIVISLILLSIPVMATISKQDSAVEKQIYTVYFGTKGNANDAFKDLRTGKEPTGLYEAGETVLLQFEAWATDVSYKFYMDGEEIEASYFNEEYGFCYHFVMPAHDVRLTWKSWNLMVEEGYK